MAETSTRSPVGSLDDSDSADELESVDDHSPPVDDPDPLLVWCLAAYHTALFTLVPVVGLHWTGALGDLLGGLSTTVGLALYLLLWATTWWTNRRLLATTPFEPSAWREILTGGVKWGGVTGSCFLLELVVVAVVQVAIDGGLGVPDVASVLPLLLFLALGAATAFVVGGLVGVVQAVLDLLALGVADAMTTAESRD
ncbi:hypothetical protein SAMN04487948_103172 [Halogranum amylolyticum]|uniref:DUF7965 domain-containing protein n=1 Tax=Halogranum amylolyticum TaxID=660520 RepID=A0A1H8QLS9_9EURY|nr:hypothetical protein [Halogranum amylolyticum]SEO54763.1 hypothetical protein SAMN04487948_103172 [Halogranum amylolyticum]